MAQGAFSTDFKWPSFQKQHKKDLGAVGINRKGQKCLLADLVLVVYTRCHFFPLRKRQMTQCETAWKKHGPVPGHWRRHSHSRTMQTWGHRAISSTHNLAGSLQFPLKNMLCTVLGSWNRPQDWSAGIPVQSHWGLLEGSGVFAFTWGSSWGTARENAPNCGMFWPCCCTDLIAVRKESRWKKCQTFVGFVFKSNFTLMTEKHD